MKEFTGIDIVVLTIYFITTLGIGFFFTEKVDLQMGLLRATIRLPAGSAACRSLPLI